MSLSREVPLRDILTPAQDRIDVEPTGTYEMAGIYSFGRGLFRKPPLVGAETTYKYFNVLKSGRFVYSRLFGWEGAVAVVPPEFDGLLVSSEFPTFDIDPAKALAEFIGFICRWPRFHQQLAGSTTGLGLRRQRVYEDALLNLQVPVPPIDEQRRIASFLDSVVARQGAAEALLVRQQRLMAAYVASMASQGGKIRQVGDMVTQVKRPVLVEPQGRYRLIGIRSAGQGLFAKQEIPGSETTAKIFYRIEEGDFIYSRLFAWQGSFALASSEFDGCVASNEFPIFQIDSSVVLPNYLRAWFRRPQTWRQVEARSSGSTPQSRNRLREDRFLELEIAIPEMQKQRKVAEALFAADRFQDLRRATWSRVGALSSATIHSAFSGAGE
jgi:type I restriction enzyme S subunit